MSRIKSQSVVPVAQRLLRCVITVLQCDVTKRKGNGQPHLKKIDIVVAGRSGFVGSAVSVSYNSEIDGREFF